MVNLCQTGFVERGQKEARNYFEQIDKEKCGDYTRFMEACFDYYSIDEIQSELKLEFVKMLNTSGKSTTPDALRAKLIKKYEKFSNRPNEKVIPYFDQYFPLNEKRDRAAFSKFVQVVKQFFNDLQKIDGNY